MEKVFVTLHNSKFKTNPNRSEASYFTLRTSWKTY